MSAPLRARIAEKRADDGHRAWSAESIAARIGCTGAAVRKICRGETRRPDIGLVDRLADVLGLDRLEITVGLLPPVSMFPSTDANRLDSIDWLGDELLAGIDRVVDSTTRSSLADGIRRCVCTARKDTQIYTAPAPSGDVDADHGATPRSWRVAAEKLAMAINNACDARGESLSNERIGRAVGTSAESVGKLRRGTICQPDLDVLHRLADFLNADVDHLTVGTVPRLAAWHPVTTERCAWLPHEVRAQLALTLPVAHTHVQRAIRLLLETIALAHLGEGRPRELRATP